MSQSKRHRGSLFGAGDVGKTQYQAVPGPGLEVPLRQRLDSEANGPGALGEFHIIPFTQARYQVHASGLEVDRQLFAELLL